MFLNKTNAIVALPMLWKFFDKYFSPESAVGANVRELSKFLRPMGLKLRIICMNINKREFKCT